MKYILAGVLILACIFSAYADSDTVLWCPDAGLLTCQNNFQSCITQSGGNASLSVLGPGTFVIPESQRLCACGCFAQYNLCLQTCVVSTVRAGNGNSDNFVNARALNSVYNDFQFSCLQSQCPRHYCQVSINSATSTYISFGLIAATLLAVFA